MSTPVTRRLQAFLAGERPDEIPFTTYFSKDRNMLRDPRWQPLFDQGLGVTFHVYPYEEVPRGVELVEDSWREQGALVTRQVQRTPVGEMLGHLDRRLAAQILAGDPRRLPRDDLDRPAHRRRPPLRGLPGRGGRPAPFGTALSIIRRTPLQTILVDLAGLERFALHLFEYEEEVRALYDALLAQFRRRVEIAAAGPGRFVANLENFTAETLGPRRYAEFLLPVYEECYPLLHAAGKVVGTHYDGRTASCRELIAGSPIDLIESLTAPPEGDQTLAEARAVWPDKLFWANINMGAYDLPPRELHDLVLRMVADAAPDGRRLAFEISEDLPPRWQESIPVILNALRETRAY